MSERQNVFSSHNLGLSRTDDYIPEETKIKLYNANKAKMKAKPAFFSPTNW